MKLFVVYRHGWDRANQDVERGLPWKMPVLRVEAEGPDDACRRALEQVTLQPDQHLSAEPADEADARENNLNLKVEAVGPAEGTDKEGGKNRPHRSSPA